MNSKKMVVSKKSLSTREKARRMVKRAKSENYEIIDLSKVEFVSRSFADELKKRSNEKGIEIRGINGNVKKMFKVVERREVLA